MALAIPRVSAPGSKGVALPQPLAPSDAMRIRRIFAAQAQNDIPAAIKENSQLTDPTLLGHLLADRYLGPFTHVTPNELSSWLSHYADLPDAPAMHMLLAARSPRGAFSSTAAARGQTFVRNPALDRSVKEPARAGSFARAVRLIAHTRGLSPLYGATLRAEVAQIMFTQGHDSEAWNLAEIAQHETSGRVGLAPFVAGLAAWRMGKIDAAAPLFEAAARAELTSPGLRSGAAFWAARAHSQAGDQAAYQASMHRAAQDAHGFYGLLAGRALGLPLAPSPELAPGTLGEADVDAILATGAGRRAFALIQVGQLPRAEAELRLLSASTRQQPGLQRSILLVAQATGLNDLASQITSSANGAASAGVTLPSRLLRPAGGFRLDPAMVYAVAKLESNFDPNAVSPAGAQGLMQIMPTTAHHIASAGDPGPAGRRLNDPATNLDLGQRYLLYLAEHVAGTNDLIRVLASYNAGPSALARWTNSAPDNNDPLLFIESIPNDETRAYVPHALTYTWLYAAHFGLPAPSLDELAAGVWPHLTPVAPRQPAALRLH